MEYRFNGYFLKDINFCINHINLINSDHRNMLKEYKNNTFLKNNLIANDYIIKFLGKGGQGNVYLLESLNCGKIVFKITKVNYESRREVYLLKDCKKIIDNKISPHFIYYYDDIILDDYYYTFMEYADGTLEDWLKEEHNESEWLSFIFQILYAIFIMQYVLKTYHADLKPKNILYKKINKGYFKYNIFDKTYYVPTFGFLFMISDFGRAQSLLFNENNLTNESILALIKDNNDLEHIETLPKRILVSALEKRFTKVEHFINYIKNNFTDYEFDKYLNTEKEKINMELSKYSDFIKKRMLLRSLMYYAVEKNYIKPNNIPDNFFTMKYPPKNIKEMIEKFFALKIPIYKILDRFDIFKNPAGNILKTFTIK